MNEAYEKGRKLGNQLAFELFAQNMFKEGCPIEEVASCTKLPLERLLQLKEEIGTAHSKT